MKRHLIIYIVLLFFAVNAVAQRSLRKLSPSVRQLVMEQQLSPQGMQKAPEVYGQRELCAFVKTDGTDGNIFHRHNTRVLATFGDIHIVSIPMAEITSLSCERSVLRIESGRGMSVLNHDMARHLNIDKVYEGTALPQAYTGKGVVVGIQDVGFDLTNPNFYSADMSQYRIKAMWDMLSTDTIGSHYYVGNSYEGEDALKSYAHSRDGLQQAHGSHTLGTAAGSGFGTKYRGIAFESDICLVNNAVSSDINLIDEKDEGKYTYATDALGFKYIFDYAQSQGKPCVISFSEGSTQDLYGDDILYNEILEQMTGPGRIIVSSAGNNSHNPNYVYKPFGKKSAGTFLETWSGTIYFMSTGQSGYDTRLVFHGEKNDTLTISSDWLCTQTDSLHYDTLEIKDRQYIVAEGAYPDCYAPEKLVVEIYIKGPDHMGGSICPISVETVGEATEVETYKIVGSFVTKPNNPQLCDAIVAKNINSPSCCEAVICVGSTSYSTGFVNIYGEEQTYDSGQNGVRSSFSSIGPTYDGRVKPEVMAPGANIVSSTNSYYFEANPDDRQFSDFVDTYEYDGRQYYWKVDTGTSMSSPAVGGAIALWLEAKPDLTREDILDVFAHTCTHPDPSMNYPNNEYGYGQIDVYRGLLYILGIDGIEEISHYQPQNVTFRVQDRSLEISFGASLKKDANVRIYTTSGQMIHCETISEGKDQAVISIPQNGRGVLAVQVDGDTKQSSGSTLIRIP